MIQPILLLGMIVLPCSSVTSSSHCFLAPVVSHEKSADDDAEDPMYEMSHFSHEERWKQVSTKNAAHDYSHQH